MFVTTQLRRLLDGQVIAELDPLNGIEIIRAPFVELTLFPLISIPRLLSHRHTLSITIKLRLSRIERLQTLDLGIQLTRRRMSHPPTRLAWVNLATLSHVLLGFQATQLGASAPLQLIHPLTQLINFRHDQS